MDVLKAFFSSPEVISMIVAAAIGGAGYLYQRGVQRLPANAQRIINTMAQTVVHSIEQKYSDQNPGGALKKQEAMSALAAMCKELGLPFNLSNANAAIESAVYTMNLYQKFQPATPSEHQQTRTIPVVSTPAPAPEIQAAG